MSLFSWLFGGMRSDADGNGLPGKVNPEWLRDRLESGEPVYLLDVREQWERDIALIRGSFSIPLGKLPERIGELPKDRPIVVICRIGGRSAQAARWLRQQGFDNTTNLAGGIKAWANRIEPAMARY